MELILDSYSNEAEVVFSVKGESELVTDGSSSVYPQKVIIKYRWGGSHRGGDWAGKGWVARIQGKCPPGSLKKTSTLSFYDNYCPDWVPGWAKELAEGNAPAAWLTLEGEG